MTLSYALTQDVCTLTDIGKSLYQEHIYLDKVIVYIVSVEYVKVTSVTTGHSIVIIQVELSPIKIITHKNCSLKPIMHYRCRNSQPNDSDSW